jgi:peptidoglycan-associated lipoprotein
MKKLCRLYPVLILAVALAMVVPSCSKKQISTDSAATAAAEEEARRKAEEQARQRELERQKAIEEETLKEEGLAKEMEYERKMTELEMFKNEDIYFEFDSIRLDPEAQEILRKKAEYMKSNPGVRVTIEGHCDNRGTNEYNLALGDRRAHSAKVFLLDLGINESRMRTVSYGEERPIDPGENEEAWSRNRRAHFVIIE